MTTCMYTEGHGPQCGRPAAATYTVGCVHEHIFDTSQCVDHKPDPTRVCGLCWLQDGHLCPVQVIGETPAAPPTPAVMIGGQWL